MISRRELDEQLAVLRSLYRDKTIPSDQFFRSLLYVAYQYAVRGDLEDVRVLVLSCDEDYFHTVLPAQMAENSEFRTTALFVAETLAASGVSAVSDEDLALSMAKIGRA